MSQADGVAVIRLQGDLEIGRKAELRKALDVPDGERRVLIDCTKVSYADSTAIAELLRFRAEAQRRGLRVAIAIASRQFARIVEYAGLSQAFEIFDDRERALDYLAEKPAS